MRTIVIAHQNSNYWEKDYRTLYGQDTIVWIWFEESDLNDAIWIALNQVENVNRVIIEK